MVLFNSAPYANWHWCTVRGYAIESEVMYRIINDPNGTPNVYVDWYANFPSMANLYIAD